MDGRDGQGWNMKFMDKWINGEMETWDWANGMEEREESKDDWRWEPGWLSTSLGKWSGEVVKLLKKPCSQQNQRRMPSRRRLGLCDTLHCKLREPVR